MRNVVACSEGVGRLGNAGTPEKTPKASTPSTDDIPVAQRETVAVAPKRRTSKLAVLGGLTLLGLVALTAGVFVAQQFQQAPPATIAIEPDTATAPKPSASPEDALLGHYAYKEAPQAQLAPITSDGGIKLRKAAAVAYRAMEAAAQQAGVSLVPISGFRSLEDQKYLYFDVKADRNQVAAERAKVSAPPGYSEHHTGYAVDIGDGSVPAVNLSPEFDKTAAYKWLQANAARYSFELSFPTNNKQGVSYEPWHWRYVGDIDSLKTFYKARNK
ncbi:D-alanyl-D-alanine carboxypeptidase family protein [Leptolyngbya sp. FACHB-36]|uniref:M15 family metallopeptidase n=1 Tax=Leptolyngbya sp. FACHB-36 TaxID=2692808 RepID=UPI001680442A|nr:M15 family metallopeptidase [Leptolyngbya sp. FACHB-36]MBD2021345.1 D-alanyl-D-alanine carboxypeptidase family protein [Leptolyngbya sp. FACHB-36]